MSLTDAQVDSSDLETSTDAVTSETASAILSALGDNLGELVAMLAEDSYDAEFLRPTPAASALARDLMIGAARGSAVPLPAVDIGPTGDGGLTAQWGREQSPYVRLLIPADPTRAYLYSRAPEVKRVSSAGVEDLIRELAWLGTQEWSE